CQSPTMSVPYDVSRLRLRQSFADVCEGLPNELLRLRIEHAAADGGNRASRDSLTVPLQRRLTSASIHDVGACSHVDGAAKATAGDFHVQPMFRGIGHQLDFQFEFAADWPNADVHN